MNRQSMREAAYRRLGEPTGSAQVRLTGTAMSSLIYEGCRETSRVSRAILGSASTGVTAQKVELVMASAMLWPPHWVEYKNWATTTASATAFKELTKTTIEELYRTVGQSWRIVTGVPTNWFETNRQRLGLWPKPTGSQGGTATIWGPRLARTLPTDTATTDLPVGLHLKPVFYACREAMIAVPELDPNGIRWRVFDALWREGLPRDVQVPHPGGLSFRGRWR